MIIISRLYNSSMSFDTYSELKKLSPSFIQKQVNSLDSNGYTGEFLNHTILDKWDSRCTDYLKGFGYNGGDLAITGYFDKKEGALYFLYDKDQITQPSHFKTRNIIC